MKKAFRKVFDFLIDFFSRNASRRVLKSALGRLLGASWAPLGSFLGDFWGLLGASWGFLECQKRRKASQRAPKGLPKASQRHPKGLPKVSWRAPKGTPRHQKDSCELFRPLAIFWKACGDLFVTTRTLSVARRSGLMATPEPWGVFFASWRSWKAFWRHFSSFFFQLRF